MLIKLRQDVRSCPGPFIEGIALPKRWTIWSRHEGIILVVAQSFRRGREARIVFCGIRIHPRSFMCLSIFFLSFFPWCIRLRYVFACGAYPSEIMDEDTAYSLRKTLSIQKPTQLIFSNPRTQRLAHVMLAPCVSFFLNRPQRSAALSKEAILFADRRCPRGRPRRGPSVAGGNWQLSENLFHTGHRISGQCCTVPDVILLTLRNRRIRARVDTGMIRLRASPGIHLDRVGSIRLNKHRRLHDDSYV